MPSGAQPQIDPEYLSGGALLAADQGRQAAGQRREILVVGNLATPLAVPNDAARLALVGGVDVHQVDIGREIQLAAAELPHADNAEAARLFGTAVVRVERLAVQRRQPAWLADPYTRLQHAIGQRRQAGSRLVDVGQTSSGPAPRGAASAAA